MSRRHRPTEPMPDLLPAPPENQRVMLLHNSFFVGLFVRLSAVAVFAQHLAIFDGRFTAFTPRRDVIALHIGDVKPISAFDADTLLPFVDGPFYAVGKSS